MVLTLTVKNWSQMALLSFDRNSLKLCFLMAMFLLRGKDDLLVFKSPFSFFIISKRSVAHFSARREHLAAFEGKSHATVHWCIDTESS